MEKLIDLWKQYESTNKPDLEIHNPDDPYHPTLEYSLSGFMWWLSNNYKGE